MSRLLGFVAANWLAIAISTILICIIGTEVDSLIDHVEARDQWLSFISIAAKFGAFFVLCLVAMSLSTDDE